MVRGAGKSPTLPVRFGGSASRQGGARERAGVGPTAPHSLIYKGGRQDAQVEGERDADAAAGDA